MKFYNDPKSGIHPQFGIPYVPLRLSSQTKSINTEKLKLHLENYFEITGGDEIQSNLSQVISEVGRI